MVSAAAFDRVLSLKPAVRRVVRAADALGLEPRQLLHAGPPLVDPCRPPPVLLSSSVMTAIHEGWVDSEAAAEADVVRGKITLHSAQAYNCVTPLAAAVSENTPLFEVADLSDASMPSTYSLVSPVLGIDTRMGNRAQSVLDCLASRDQVIAAGWNHWLSKHGPLDLWSIAMAGMADGDDLHFRTATASSTLGQVLATKDTDQWIDNVARTPTYFLTLWMAAGALMLNTASQVSADTKSGFTNQLICRAGGNGEQFGISLATNPTRWICVTADAPTGPRFAGSENFPACGAIGDSAVIDMAGFGAQRLAYASEAREAFASAGVLPADYAAVADKICALVHRGLTPARPLLVDGQRIQSQKITPLIALAMLEATGQHGLLGRGLYRPPLTLFDAALSSVLT